MLSNVDLKDEYKNTETSRNYHHRPSYPDDVFVKIQEYMKARGCLSPYFAVDVACGTGLSSLPLAKFCDKVVAFDVSETQLAQAPKDVPNVEFRKGDAHDMTSFIDPESVDLVTIATSLHWLDTDKFFEQVKRALKPGGVLAVYMYSPYGSMVPRTVEQEFYKCWLNKLKAVDCYSSYFDEYKDIAMPFPGWIRDTELTAERDYTVPEFIGLLKSISTFTRLEQDHPELKVYEETAEIVETSLAEEKAKDPDFDGKIKTTWPVIMLMGQKPRQ